MEMDPVQNQTMARCLRAGNHREKKYTFLKSMVQTNCTKIVNRVSDLNISCRHTMGYTPGNTRSYLWMVFLYPFVNCFPPAESISSWLSGCD